MSLPTVLLKKIILKEDERNCRNQKTAQNLFKIKARKQQGNATKPQQTKGFKNVARRA
jgi:hypothetical protein